MKERDDIEQLFGSAFEDFSAAPPASVKESIDLALIKKQKAGFLRIFLSVLALLFIGIATAIWLNHEPDKVIHLSETTVSTDMNEQQPENQNQDQNQSGVSPNKIQTTQKKTEPEQIAEKTETNEKMVPANAEQAASDQITKTNKIKPEKTEKQFNLSKSKQLKNKKINQAEKNIQPGKNIQSAKTQNQRGTVANKSKQKNKGQVNKGNASLTNFTEYSNNRHTPAEIVKEENTDPVKQENPTLSTKNITAPKGDIKIDSLAVHKAVQDDSIAATEISDAPIEKEKDKSKRHPFLLSIRTGNTLGFNRAKSNEALGNFKIAEKGAFFLQCEAAYFITPHISVGTGLNYSHWWENVTKNSEIIGDSVFMGYVPQYIYENAVVIDTIYTPVYENPVTKVTEKNSYQLYAYSFPVMATYSQELFTKLHLDLSVGALLSLQGRKVVSEGFTTPINTVNSFGLRPCVRTQIRYQFSQWGVSFNTNFGYDLHPVNAWDGLKRTRTFLDFGIGLHYQIGK